MSDQDNKVKKPNNRDFRSIPTEREADKTLRDINRKMKPFRRKSLWERLKRVF